jgi:hypothetical protein
VEAGGVRVESVVHLKDWVKKQELKPKMVHQGVLISGERHLYFGIWDIDRREQFSVSISIKI